MHVSVYVPCRYCGVIKVTIRVGGSASYVHKYLLLCNVYLNYCSVIPRSVLSPGGSFPQRVIRGVSVLCRKSSKGEGMMAKLRLK